MVSNVDMALDQYIKTNKIRPNRGGGRGGRGGRGRGGKQQGRGAKRVGQKGRGGQVQRGRGGARGKFNRGGQAKRGFFRPRAAANVARNFVRPQGTGPAKIELSNLDFGVSDGDIKELFSEFGSLKMAAIHYNAQGKSMGKASLVYARRADAIKAIKQYNGVALDGRTMNLKLEGAAAQAGFNKSPVKRLGRGAAGVRGARGGARGRGGAGGKFKRGAKTGRGGAQKGRGGKAGRGGKKFVKPKPKTAEELDAELDAYLQTKTA